MKLIVNFIFLLVAVLLLTAVTVSAEVPQVINYQGRLTDSGDEPVADGPYLIKFKIYGSATGDDSLWYTGFQPVQVTGGLFSYQLGSTAPLPDNLFATDTTRYLGITAGADPEITPRTRITSMAYAYQALRADSAGYATTIPDNSVTSAKIQNGAIVNADVNNSANISPSKISGTAATLSGTQTFTGINTYRNWVHFYDSVMSVYPSGVKIGDPVYLSSSHLLHLERNYNTPNIRKGLFTDLTNQSNGTLYGIYSYVRHTTPGSGGTAAAIRTETWSDGGNRYAYHGYCRAYNRSISTGYSYGIRVSADDGNTAYGIYALAGSATTNYAGYFQGNVTVSGTLGKGGGGFIIDHPLDPENRYLYHSFVESPDMKNVYDGVVVLNGNGEAIVELPDYFEVVNRDFRYQLTCVGRFAPVYIAEEISGNHFKIAGAEPGMKVSWQVTGIRHDKWAEANRIQVDVEKAAHEKGLYLHPEAFGLGPEKFVNYEQNKEAERDLEERSEE